MQDAYVSCSVTVTLKSSGLILGYHLATVSMSAMHLCGGQWGHFEVHSVAAPGLKTSKTWELLGKNVSEKCLATLLGMGTDRLHSASRGRLDMRYRCFGKAP